MFIRVTPLYPWGPGVDRFHSMLVLELESLWEKHARRSDSAEGDFRPVAHHLLLKILCQVSIFPRIQLHPAELSKVNTRLREACALYEPIIDFQRRGSE